MSHRELLFFYKLDEVCLYRYKIYREKDLFLKAARGNVMKITAFSGLCLSCVFFCFMVFQLKTIFYVAMNQFSNSFGQSFGQHSIGSSSYSNLVFIGIYLCIIILSLVCMALFSIALFSHEKEMVE
jgi:hypothetical protein